MTKTPLGILAGRGIYPKLLFDNIARTGTPVVVAGLSGQTRAALFKGAVYQEFPIGALWKTAAYFRDQGVGTLYFAGGIERKGALGYTRPDRGGWRLLLSALFKGDDSLLRRTADVFSGLGLEVKDPNPFIQDLLTPEGHLAGPAPSPAIREDLKIAFEAAKALGARDRGQAVIVRDGRVVAREGRRGTDHLIETTDAPGGVLVKAVKPGQDRRFDLPAIGPETIVNSSRRRIVAVGVEANGVLVLTSEVTFDRCAALGIGLIGCG